MSDKPKGDYYSGPQAGDFAEAGEPFALFETWFAEAQAHEPNDPNAMALASVDASGLPNVRMVLLKGLDASDHPARGFVFYTNLESAKGARAAGRAQGRPVLPLEIATPAGAGARRRSRAPATPRPTPISPRAPAAAGWAPGPRSSRVPWRAASRSRRPSPPSPPGTQSARSPDRPTGRAFASRRSRWNSGTTAPSACTSASPSGAGPRASRGARIGCIRRVILGLHKLSPSAPRSSVVIPGLMPGIRLSALSGVRGWIGSRQQVPG